MNYKCIDPKIKDTIKLMHKSGIKTAACCAGVGISKTYSGKIFAKRHPNKVTKTGLSVGYIYVYDSAKARELINNLKSVKIPSYKNEIRYGDQSFFEVDRERDINGYSMIDIRFPYVVLSPLFYPDTFKNVDIKNYRKYLYRMQIKWIQELHKQVEKIKREA